MNTKRTSNIDMAQWMKANGFPLAAHPGEILKRSYLDEMGISAYRLSKDTGISQMMISGIIKGTKKITVNTAIRLAKHFDQSARFWMAMQDNFELKYMSQTMSEALAEIPLAEQH